MDSVDARIARLETHFEYIRSDLSEIKVALGDMNGRLDHLPTKRDLTTNILVIVTIGVAVIAIVVGGLLSGLGWLETRTSRLQTTPTPIVIQVPQAADGAHGHP